MVKRVWSLAERMAIGVGLALFMLSMILGVSGYVTLSSLFESNLTQRAESQARQLALFSADAILVYDYATLERYALALAQEPGIMSVVIKRHDGEKLAEAGTPQQASDLSLIHVQQKLRIGNSDIGVVQLSVDRKGMEDSLQRMALIGLGVLVVALILLFWFLRRFIHQGLILPVQQLARAANPLNAKQCPEPTQLPLELEQLARTFRGLCSDIKNHLKQREHAEQVVREVNERLTREQRLATVGQMAAGLAHNLNTPLGSIKGYAQLLSERLSDEGHRHHAALIVEQAESCAGTVRNLLTAVRLPEVEQIEFDLYQQVVGAVELIRPLLRGQNTKIVGPEKIVKQDLLVLGDPGALEQILFNLLTNAAQAGASEVSIKLQKKQPKACWEITVSDNGPGIPETLRSSMFDPFVTDKPPGKGTGLGLYMSQQMASKMGAKLSLVRTSLQSGTQFMISIATKTDKSGN